MSNLINNQSNIPLVSVVIPAYNAEATLARAVQSVLDDRHPRKEVLIVDDGSTDATRTAARQLLRTGPESVRLIEFPNGGANRARNIGLRQAEGTFVQFLDADDWLVNNKLSRSVDLFGAEDNGDVRLVYTGPKSTSAEDLASGEISLFTHGINTVAAMWRREFLVSAGLEWDEELSCWQEAEFFFRALIQIGGRHRVRNLPGVFFMRDRNTEGISSRYFSEDYILVQDLAIEKIYDRCRKMPNRTARVDRQHKSYKQSLLGRSIICGAPKAWNQLAPEVRGLSDSLRWKCASRMPYPAVRAAYVVYRSLKRLIGIAK